MKTTSGRAGEKQIQVSRKRQIIIHSGSAVITWSWNGRLLSAGPMKVYEDDRMEILDNGRKLLIRGVTKSDRGEYSCTINLKLEPVSLSHNVEVLGKEYICHATND